MQTYTEITQTIDKLISSIVIYHQAQPESNINLYNKNKYLNSSY